MNLCQINPIVRYHRIQNLYTICWPFITNFSAKHITYSLMLLCNGMDTFPATVLLSDKWFINLLNGHILLFPHSQEDHV